MPGLAVLYRWKLHPGSEASFIEAWSRVTALLRERGGSLSSRLHRGNDGVWYGHAQWPSAEARELAFAQHRDPAAGAEMHAAVAESFLNLPPGAPWTTDAEFDAITAYFEAPEPAEGFNVIRHERA